MNKKYGKQKTGWINISINYDEDDEDNEDHEDGDGDEEN